MKRKLEDHEVGLADQRQKQRELETFVHQAVQNQSVNVSLAPYPYASPQLLAQEVQEKVLQPDDGPPAALVPTPPEPENGEFDQLKYRLISFWERLVPYDVIGSAQVPEVLARRDTGIADALRGLDRDQVEFLHAWSGKYRPEIESVRAVRNAVAHPPSYTSRDDVLAAIKIAETLLHVLEEQGFPTPDDGR